MFCCSKLGLDIVLPAKVCPCLYRFCLRHVGDDAVGDDEENEVLGPVSEGSGDVGHVVDRRGKVGWTVKLNPAKAAFVGS